MVSDWTGPVRNSFVSKLSIQNTSICNNSCHENRSFGVCIYGSGVITASEFVHSKTTANALFDVIAVIAKQAYFPINLKRVLTIGKLKGFIATCTPVAGRWCLRFSP